MRKLKLQVQMTVDGFVGRDDGGLDWMTWSWDNELKDFVTDLTRSVDSILFGRKMTDGFISHWKKVAEDKNSSEHEAGVIFTEYPKYVFSKTLEKSIWDNTQLCKGNIKNEVDSLKKKDGRDIIVYGGASFVSSLIKENLIDDYYLFINPVAIGKGLTIFGKVDKKFELELADSKKYSCGITVNHYQPKKN